MTPSSVSAHTPAVRIVHLDNVAPQLWRNGGGMTRELIAWPSADAWLVRVSVARIARDGPFSAFPGVWRWFTVLNGAGVSLEWPDRKRTLTRGDEGTAFDGNDAPACRLLDGETDDLNVMWDMRVSARGVSRVVPGSAWSSSATWRAVYTDAPCTLLIGNGAQAQSHTLDARTLAWSEVQPGAPIQEEAWRIHTAVPVRAWWLWATQASAQD
ncbi:MAG: HutD family protein [Gemmatimonadaceae bacterium]|nr:HutD family protein [Gemmatimonadaceae bacterium]